MIDMIETIAAALRALSWEDDMPLNVFDDAEKIARTAIIVMRAPSEITVDPSPQKYEAARALLDAELRRLGQNFSASRLEKGTLHEIQTWIAVHVIATLL